jgi:DNA-binding NarL/FixJ family response regulator
MLEENTSERESTNILRILLADDHELFREGVCSLLSYQDDMQVVGQATNGREAVERARELMPDVVLMDIDMPLVNGLEATQLIAAELPYVKIVMLTVCEDEDKLFQAIRNGAQGYLLKNIRITEMLEMLRGMAAGEAPISRLMASRLLKEFAQQSSTSIPTSPSQPARLSAPYTMPLYPSLPSTKAKIDQHSKNKTGSNTASFSQSSPFPSYEKLEQLSSREHQVLELVAQRATNKEIANALCISEYTVKNHLRNILAKLHLQNRTQAARMLQNFTVAAKDN